MAIARRQPHIPEIILATGLFLSYAYFYQAGGWNQNSRFDLVRAIVEQGTLRIDCYHENTGDKAESNGHYYSDKAPGLALAAVPVAAAVAPLLGAPSDDEYAYVMWLSYLLTVALSALPTAMAAWLLYVIARRFEANREGAAVAALLFGLATPAWAYATLLFGHALTTCLLIAAYACSVAIAEEKGALRDIVIAGTLGLTAGWAAVTEYPTVLPAFAIAGYALIQAWPGGWKRRRRVGAAVSGGALVGLAALLLYNQATFGSAFEIGYTNVVGFGEMGQGMMGVTYPKLDVLRGILVGRHRGLLFHAPVLLAGLAGFVPLLRGAHARAGWVAFGVVVYYALFNSAYAYWDGGWSYGPRHMAPALPFLCLPLAVLWSRGTRGLRTVISGLASVSFAFTFIAVSTTAQPPNGINRPLPELLWPAFRDGDLSLNHQSFLEVGADAARLRGGVIPHDAWNLGEKLGLHGLASLLPLIGLWIACALVYVRTGSEEHGGLKSQIPTPNPHKAVPWRAVVATAPDRHDL